VTAVEERLTKPLRSGSRLAMIGLVVTLAGQAAPPGPPLGWLLNLAGVVAATWGVVRVAHWVARLSGRRSLSELAIGLGLVGASDALAISAAQSSFDREHDWTLGIAAALIAALGLSLAASGIVDFRKEQRQIDDPPPAPGPDAISEPQHPGRQLQEYQSTPLRTTLIIASVSMLITLVVVFVR
jgi:hypothetical protein